MQRRNFLITAATSIPALALGSNSKSEPKPTDKGFVIKTTESRFKEKTLLGGKNPNDIKVSSKDTNGSLSIFEYSGFEKGGPPLHVHPNQDEIFFIVQGEYLFKVGDDTHQLKAGDTIFLPRNIPHAFAQLTDIGKMFFLFQPSGKMEDFFRVLGNLRAAPSPEQGAKIFSDHDMKIIGPPLTF